MRQSKCRQKHGTDLHAFKPVRRCAIVFRGGFDLPALVIVKIQSDQTELTQSALWGMGFLNSLGLLAYEPVLSHMGIIFLLFCGA
eukprot:2168113-Amphidinium_carterae.1